MNIKFSMAPPKFNFGDIVTPSGEGDNLDPEICIIVGIDLYCGVGGESEWTYTTRTQYFGGIKDWHIGEDEIEHFDAKKVDPNNKHLKEEYIKNSFYGVSIPHYNKDAPVEARPVTPEDFKKSIEQLKKVSSNLDFANFCREILRQEPRFFDGNTDSWQTAQFERVRKAVSAIGSFDQTTLEQLAKYNP